MNSSGDAGDANTGDSVCQTFEPGVCTLRAAVQQANVTGGLIKVPAVTIAIGSEIEINRSMTIQGAGMRATVVSGGNLRRIFLVQSLTGNAISVSISDMTLRDGDSGGGSAIFCVFGNTLNVDRCYFTNNYGSGGGGAIVCDGNTDVTIRDSVFASNHAPNALGGAVYCYRCALTIADTAIHGSTAGSGGGLLVDDGSAQLTNVTVGANVAAQDGGGILSRGTDFGGSVTLRSSTVASNHATAGQGGGVHVVAGSHANIKNTIVANNTRISKGQTVSSDCFGTLTSYEGNSVVPGACTLINGPYLTGSPQLGSLQENGGASGPTFALRSGSSALAAGTDGCPLTDQRGIQRPQGAPCDIGAYEQSACGDANGDGAVTVSDVLFVINFLFAGGPTPPGLASVDGAVGVTVSDVLGLINHLFAGGSLICTGT